MKLKTWFLKTATVRLTVAAKHTGIPREDFLDAVEELELAPRLTLQEIQDVIAYVEDDTEDGDDRDPENEAP